jgi:hypothetical protein
MTGKVRLIGKCTVTMLWSAERRLIWRRSFSSLNVTCPECRYSIPPNEQMRVSIEQMRYPKCGKEFRRT